MARATKKKDEKITAAPKGKYLVIVESPAKAKTIKKILGDSFQIKASFGHIRDFPKKTLGVNVKKHFEPSYEVIPEKQSIVDDLNKSAKSVDKVYLAPDPDREGEAIAWHIAAVLDKKPEDMCRIEFNEITKTAILDAIQNPRQINMDKVNAQQARHVLDRLVGYKISPILWQKVKGGKNLSAGRVQSVAVRIICDREEEIDAFTAEEYWTIDASFAKPKSSVSFAADLVKYNGEKIEIKNDEEASKILETLEKKNVEFKVSKVSNRETKRKPQAPFITSTLQREASTRLGYTVKKTMQVAQKLYEGVELGSGEHVGLITYMRTDSTRISDEAKTAAKDYIVSHYGKNYYPDTPRTYAAKGKNVQDAHEAIRPTYVDKSPESIKQHLTNEQYKLYKLIWSRFVASQMESATVKTNSIEIDAENYTFRASYSKITFDGFLIVYNDSEDEEKSLPLPDFSKGDTVKLKNINKKQHFTQPPPRFSEASLVKTLEEKGIGRPSTYASIISKIQERMYVIKEEKALKPTELGKVVNKLLVKHFTDIVNYNFTANMENKLDDIAEHSVVWQDIIEEFYDPFKNIVKKAKDEMEKVEILSDQVCPNCGKPMAIKSSRWGTQFLGCSGYPECKTIQPLSKDNKPVPEDAPSDEVCDNCQAPMVIKYGPYGQYLACTNEDCKAKKKIVKKTGVKCPQADCDGDIIQKKSRYGKIFYGCSKYPNCNFALWNEPTGDKCPDCSSMLVKKFLKKGNKIACSSKECKYETEMETAETEPKND